MLQNPSKYHPNPLSHFLALHNSQTAAAVAVAHNNAHPHTLPVQSHHYQQSPHAAIMSQRHHSQSHIQQLSSSHPHAHLIDATNTSLDVGKSFTIAAILGLQKSAIENNRKEYNNVINLSLNGGSNSSCNQHSHQAHIMTGNEELERGEQRLMARDGITNNSSNNNNANACKTNTNAAFNGVVNNFNCDNNTAAINGATLVNRYMATTTAASAAATTFVASAAQQQQQQQHQQQALTTSQMRVHSFAAAAAAAAAVANVGSAPSALQSLQQLHQHHAQQTSLSFQREKLKSECTAKKANLKNKRVRTIFTPEQLERLEAEFERQQYMVGPERLYLAHTLALTEAQVKVWFQNRRIKWRKHHLEITQQRLALLRQNQLPAATTNPAASTAASSSSASCEETEDNKHNDDFSRPLSESRHGSDSDLSICNDSLEADSVMDGGEDT